MPDAVVSEVRKQVKQELRDLIKAAAFPPGAEGGILSWNTVLEWLNAG
jgi:hypothetical protein